MFEGEGNRDALFSFISTAIEFYEDRQLLVNKTPLPVMPTTMTTTELDEDVVDSSSPAGRATISSLRLSYPGKVAVSGRRIAIADSANHRIIIGTLEDEDDEKDGEYGTAYCVIDHVIGGPMTGFRDGPFGDARSCASSCPLFRFPQGVTWWDDDGEEKLIVADTENHLVRIITFASDSQKGSVDTLVGKPGKYPFVCTLICHLGPVTGDNTRNKFAGPKIVLRPAVPR